jgi:phenylacetic acid degradation operon negative regulatory protein
LTDWRRALAGAVDGERPLTARSVLASTLLGSDPPVMATARLVRVAELFGVTDNAARVALSRMGAAGEVEATGDGWRLAGHLLDRQARLAAGRHPIIRPWSAGPWMLLVVTAGARPANERARLRTAMGRRHFAEYRDGVWCRPDNLDGPALPADLAGQVGRWTGRPDEPDATLVNRLWDLRAWADRADELRRRLRAVAPALERVEALAPGFVLDAAVIRHLAQDPLLPEELLPHSWPGGALREEFDEWDRAYRSALAGWQRSAAGQRSAPA